MPATAARYRLPGLVVLCLFLSASFGAQDQRSNPDLTAHEWGTFTSIAGRDGQARAWLPQTGSTDLPGFVEHLREVNFKAGVRGTVRMETPVLYFYSPRETTLSVRVSFARGLITEWYPHASHVEPGEVRDAEALYQRHASGSVMWNSVTVAPSLAARFPQRGSGEPVLRRSGDFRRSSDREKFSRQSAGEISVLPRNLNLCSAHFRDLGA